MNPKYDDLLKSKMSAESYAKLTALKNQKVYDFVGEFAEHCDPASIFVCDDSEKDNQYIRDQALAKGEEHSMALSKQTIHWDGYGDQARDKVNTRYMVYPENLEKMKTLNSVAYDEGYKEIMGIAKDNMKGKDAVVKFLPKDLPAAFLPSPVSSLPTAGTLLIQNQYSIAPLMSIFST